MSASSLKRACVRHFTPPASNGHPAPAKTHWLEPTVPRILSGLAIGLFGFVAANHVGTLADREADQKAANMLAKLKSEAEHWERVDEKVRALGLKEDLYQQNEAARELKYQKFMTNLRSAEEKRQLFELERERQERQREKTDTEAADRLRRRLIVIGDNEKEREKQERDREKKEEIRMQAKKSLEDRYMEQVKLAEGMRMESERIRERQEVLREHTKTITREALRDFEASCSMKELGYKLDMLMGKMKDFENQELTRMTREESRNQAEARREIAFVVQQVGQSCAKSARTAGDRAQESCTCASPG